MRLKLGIILLVLGAVVLSMTSTVVAAPGAQQPTVSIPTVTGTPKGPLVTVPEITNVRLGPGVEYDKVGVMIAGQQASALGRSPSRNWIQILYPGAPGDVAWVYAYNVILDPGPELPIVEPPPTPTPRVTATVDPTLAAQFNLSETVPTRLPTFTAPPPVVQPTFEPVQGLQRGSGFPPILAIVGLLMLGLFGTVVSLLRGR